MTLWSPFCPPDEPDGADPQPAHGKRHVVGDDEHPLPRDGVLHEQPLHRFARKVHVRLRLGEEDRRSADPDAPGQGPAVEPVDPLRAGRVGGEAPDERVQHLESDVVPRPDVAVARVAEPHDEGELRSSLLLLLLLGLRGGLLGLPASLRRGAFLFLLALLQRPRARRPQARQRRQRRPRASRRPRPSCSGDVSEDAVGVADDRGASSSTFRSATRRTLPASRSETSTLMEAGMSAGRHSISSSRVTTSRRPPSLTPAGDPDGLDRDLHLQLLVEQDPDEVDVDERPRERADRRRLAP